MSSGTTETPAPSESGEQIVEADRNTLIHPYLAAITDERVVMARGKGSRLWDSDGTEYVDATGGLWLAQVGHGRSELGEVAAKQMAQLEYFASFWEYTNDKAVTLASRLVELAPPRIDHVYFTSGGSEGNEAAMRLARYYHHRRGDGNRTWMLSRQHGYHGIGYGSGSLSGSALYHDGFGPMVPHIRHLTPPWPYHAELYDGMGATDYCVAELERTIEELGPDQIAGFIGEPIMGVAGMVIPPADYWPRIQEILQRNGILLILDEVVTAYGRVGEWFAARHYDLDPDIIVTAKGISSGYVPLGAVLMSDQVAAAISSGDGWPIGYTYNGHPTACAVGLANLDIIEREGLLDLAKSSGRRLLERLRGLEDLPVVGEVRGEGMMFGIELVADKESRRPLPMADPPLPNVVRHEHKVIVRTNANEVGHSIVLSPPLVLTEEEGDRIVSALRDTLQRMRPDGTWAS
jgi:PLP-dependent transaminase